jgi:hypothetical protein
MSRRTPVYRVQCSFVTAMPLESRLVACNRTDHALMGLLMLQ